MLKLEVFVVNHFQENTYLVYDEDSRKALIIDPGANDLLIDRRIVEGQFKLEGVICTHCHPDHVAGAQHYCTTYKAPFFIHEHEKVILDAYNQWAPALGFATGAVPQPNGFLKQDDDIPLGKSTLKIIETPGHTPGGICFYCVRQKMVFSGDTLFQSSIGRSDFPGGNGAQLIKSIQDALLTLPQDTVVYPGHGPSTSIADEKTGNPFLNDI
jgi:hydroxyacylglutathione hydrolase